MTQLVEELSLATGLNPGNLPDDLVRPLVLAHSLEGEGWLKERPESAPGLAEEFVGLFDEVRLHGCTEAVLEDGPLEDLLPRADFITLHVPLTDATYRFIGERELNRMKS